MIKMTIGGEEVVSNKEFTINEEMLSASSTILNNCYPKSWEDNKDYTSNFYYPKDYSKFLLGEGEFLHGNNEFEPLEITGKNLFQVYDLTNGIVKSYNSGEININGTITGSAYYSQIGTTTLKSGTYYFSFNSSVPLPAGSRILFIKNGTAEHLVYDNTTVVISENVTYDIGLVLNAGTFLNVVLRPQIEFGNVKTSYEPYNQPNLSYETNIEKEWNSFNIYGNTYQETRSGYNLLVEIGNGSSNSSVSNGNIIFNFGVNQDTYRRLNFTKELNKFYTVVFDGSGLASGESINFTLEGNGTGNYSFKNGKNVWVKKATTSGSLYQQGFIIDDVSRENISSTITLSNIMVLEGSYTEQTLPPYEPYGVSPSPDYPSELVSVGYENIIPQPTYEASDNSRQTDFTWLKELKTGTYTISFDLESFDLGTNTTVSIYFDTFNIGVINSSSKLERYSETINITSPKASSSTSNFRISQTNYNNGARLKLTNIQLEKGTQAHSYIPYGKYGIEINNFGKNLFDEEQLLKASDWRKNDDGYYYGIRSNLYSKYKYANGGFTFNFDFKENTQYTISFIAYSSINSGNPRLEIYYTDGTSQYTPNYNTTTPTLITRTSSAGKTIAAISYGYGSGSSAIDYLKNIQLEENTQATNYEEHKSNSQLYILDEPLRRIGNYADRLYINNGVLFIERKIGNIILNGSEVGWSNQGGQAPYSLSVDNLKRINSQVMVKSSNFVGVSYNSNWTIYNALVSTSTASSSMKLIKFKYVDMATLDNFKSWLSTHNTEVQYVLDEPTTTPIGYVNLPNAYEGQNTTYLYTGLETSMEVYYYWKNFNVLFAGVVKNTGDISLNPRYPHYCNLQILDYKTFLSESNTLDFVIANKTVKEAIGMVVNAISGYGFILGEINIDSADDIIGAYSTLNKTAYDVLQYLANISGSRWRARYVDSSTMAIDFYDPDTLPQGADIEYTQEYWENNNIVDLTFNYGTRDYRNKQILLSDEVYANINYNETLISNGYTNTFTLQNNIGTVVNILVGNEEKTVATTNDKQMGIDADFYYAPGKNIIESNSVYSAGTLIKITYQPLVKGRQIVYNTNEVDRISTQTDTEGVIARYENRNDILSSDELEKIAQTYIEYKGKAEVILTLTTRNNDLYNIGEVVYFDAPIPDLAQNYMVKTKKTEYIVIDEIVNLFYIYEMTSSFNSEKAINYFDNQRNKASGNIAEGDSITRNIDIETDVAIIWTGGTVSSASITVDGDNVLNSVLNSPFVE